MESTTCCPLTCLQGINHLLFSDKSAWNQPLVALVAYILNALFLFEIDIDVNYFSLFIILVTLVVLSCADDSSTNPTPVTIHPETTTPKDETTTSKSTGTTHKHDTTTSMNPTTTHKHDTTTSMNPTTTHKHDTTTSKNITTTHRADTTTANHNESSTTSTYSNSSTTTEEETTTNPHTPIPPQPSKCVVVTAS